MDEGRAMAFVRSRGNIIERGRLEHVMYGKHPDARVMAGLAGMQNADGGFSYFFEGSRVSTIMDTLWVILWLDDLGIHSGPVADGACRFLLDRQQPDGGWDEVREVGSLAAPVWLTPGRLATRTWLTPYCAHALLLMGHAEELRARSPADFLLAHQDECGRIAGYARATWIALPLFSLDPGRDSSAFSKALEFAHSRFSPGWAASDLAWLLRCLRDAGVSARHPLAAAARQALKAAQRPDGSWAAEDGPRYDVTSTVDALRILREYP